MKLQNIKQYAKSIHLSYTRTRELCRKGKIKGAIKCGGDWLIPKGVKTDEEISLHSTKTYAEEIGCSQMQVRRWIKEKRIIGDLIGRNYVIDGIQELSPDMERKINKMRKRSEKGQAKEKI